MNDQKISQSTVQVKEDGIFAQDSFGRPTYLKFSEPLRAVFSIRKNSPVLKGSGGAISFETVPGAERDKLFLSVFQTWKALDSMRAKKAAFDYIEAQSSFLPVVFFCCLLFFTPLSIALFADATHQWNCTNSLRAGTVSENFQVIKSKRKRKGHYILTLEATVHGKVVKGQDQWIGDESVGHPKVIPALFSQNDPQCWSLPRELNGAVEPNWAKRRYFTVLSAGFGFAILIVSFFGFYWSYRLWVRKPPYTSELKQLFQL